MTPIDPARPTHATGPTHATDPTHATQQRTLTRCALRHNVPNIVGELENW